MAQRVMEAKKVKATRSVLLDGGWVPWKLMTPSLQLETLSMMTTQQREAWSFDDVSLHLVFDGAKGKQKDPFRDKGEGREGQDQGDGDEGDGDEGDGDEGDGDEGDESESEGQGGSGGNDKNDDAPVMHSEFDPWGKKVEECMEKLAEGAEYQSRHLTVAMDTVEGLVKASAAHERSLRDLAKKVSEGNIGGGEGGIRKIILVTPKAPEGRDLPENELYHAMFPRLLKNVGAGCHVYLPGPPGSGKSHAAAQVARALDWRFGSISLGPTTTESRLWGGMTANGEFFEPAFVELARYAGENPESGAVFCLDEMDNGNAGIIATMNSALANGFFTAPNGDNIKWGRNFVIVAGANTFGTGPTAEFAGRNKLDAATLDRFNYLPWDTDLAMERTIVEGTLHENPALAADWLDVWHSARKNVASHGLKVFITMRGAARGAAMLAAGDSIFDVLNEVLLFKLPADQAAKVNPL